jgi:hypothetical protein
MAINEGKRTKEKEALIKAEYVFNPPLNINV